MARTQVLAECAKGSVALIDSKMKAAYVLKGWKRLLARAEKANEF